MSRIRAYLELLRLPTVFTAIADVLMGAAVASTAWPELSEAWVALRLPLAVLLGASSCLYLAGMVLNDYFDQAQDLAERPKRPIPSGRVSPLAASSLGIALLVVGVALSLIAARLIGSWRPALVGGAIAACVLAYDSWLKRTVVGPLAMGACRALNALLGMSLATGAMGEAATSAEPWQLAHYLIAGGLGIFVAGVTAVGRTEARMSKRGWLVVGLLLMLGGIGMIAFFPFVPGVPPQPGMAMEMWPLVWLALGLQVGWRVIRTIAEPRPGRVQATVRYGILSLVVFDGIIT